MSESSSPVSPDPWKDVADALRELPVHWVAPQMQAVRSAITAARAADALRHQQEIGDIRSRHWQEKLGLETSITYRDETNGRLHKKLEELRAALSTAEATIQQQTAELATVAAERDAERQRWLDTRCREVEHSIRADRAEATIASLQTAELEANAIIASLTAERDALKAGATTVTFGDTDATIAALVAERDAAQQEIEALEFTNGSMLQAIDIACSGAIASAKEVQALREALEGLKREHTNCEDCWYSCPKSVDGCCDGSQGDDCNCGADQHNAKIDAALSSSPHPQEPQP